MKLDNLVRAGSLQPHVTSAAEVQLLLAAARRNLADAAVTVLSDESRYDLAFKAIVQCALVGLAVAGYSAPHASARHETVIQSLPLTLRVSWEDWMTLETLRRQRDAMDDSGGLVDAAAVDQCVARAQALYLHLERWLMLHRPELLDT